MARRPQPPPGQTAPLAWTGRDPRRLLSVFLGLMLLSAALFSLADGGLAWTAEPLLWLIPAVLSALAALVVWARMPSMSAGADWFRCGASWVKTSRLAHVRLHAGSRPALFLEDGAGRDLELDVTGLSAHPELNALLLASLRRAAADLDLDSRTRDFLLR
ncbi:hypothetical protein [Actinocorallia populi]|uniref:hypothetical protein n=1 Tax=Actinocorallia populi TaxID=2079200 RepID=UPI000D08C407|nr:hypothetical protein [Actinocorallia populi]